MKNLLVNSMFDNFRNSNNIEILWKIQKIKSISKILNYLKVSEHDVVALISDDKESKTLFQIACILTGNNYVVFDRSNFDAYTVTMLKVKTLFIDISENLAGLRAFDIFSGSFIENLIDFKSYRLYASKYLDFETIPELLGEVPEIKYIDRESNWVGEFEVSNLQETFYNECVKEHSFAMAYVIHPGISTITSKISVFNTEALFTGALKVIDDLYNTIANKNIISTKQDNLPVLNIQILEDVALPYIFLNGAVLSLFSKGKFSFKLEKHGYNTLLISSENLERLLEAIIEESSFMSWLSKVKAVWILSKVLKYKFLNTSKDLKLILLYGKTSKNLRRYIKNFNLKVVYIYTMVEVASFVSFEFYDKFPVKTLPTVGVLPKNVVLNSGFNKDGFSEILINTEDKMMTYTDIEFTELCSMSEKYIGMHGTLDIGKNVNGKLQVQGKADAIFKNENGLVIQQELIYSIALNNYFVRDVLLIADDNKLYLLVELKLGSLLYENKSMSEVEKILNSKTLSIINKSIEEYSKIEAIKIVPRGFKRKKGKIKSSDYLF